MKEVINMNSIFNERIRFPIPTRELERRWRLVRESMKAQDIDLLIMQNDNQYMGGYVRYFTDIAVEQAYPVSVIFPVDDEMITISSASSKSPLPPEWAVRGVGKRIGAPYFRTMYYTNEFDAVEMAKVIKQRGSKKVGFVGMGLINAAIYKYLTDNCPKVEFVDASDLVDEIKAVKSEDELVYVMKALKLHDMIAAAMPSLIRPGRYEYEVRTDIYRILANHGSEEQLVMMGSAPNGTRTPHLHSFFQNRRIGEGDDVLVMVEVNGPGGYYCEITRTWCLGEPSKHLLDAWEMAKKVQHYTASLIKPGVRACDVREKANEFLVNHGLPPEERLLAHGQGYDLVERPSLAPADTMTFKENMVIAIHPTVANEHAFAMCCDNYLVTAEGAKLLQKTPQEVIVI